MRHKQINLRYNIRIIQEEKRTLPRAPAGVSEFVYVAALVPGAPYPCSGSGILTRFPFDRSVHTVRTARFSNGVTLASIYIYVTGFWKTVPNRTTTEIHSIA